MHRIFGWPDNPTGYRIRQAEYPFIKKTGYPAKLKANNFLLLEKANMHFKIFFLAKSATANGFLKETKNQYCFDNLCKRLPGTTLSPLKRKVYLTC